MADIVYEHVSWAVTVEGMGWEYNFFSGFTSTRVSKLLWPWSSLSQDTLTTYGTWRGSTTWALGQTSTGSTSEWPRIIKSQFFTILSRVFFPFVQSSLFFILPQGNEKKDDLRLKVFGLSSLHHPFKDEPQQDEREASTFAVSLAPWYLRHDRQQEGNTFS